MIILNNIHTYTVYAIDDARQMSIFMVAYTFRVVVYVPTTPDQRITLIDILLCVYSAYITRNNNIIMSCSCEQYV